MVTFIENSFFAAVDEITPVGDSESGDGELVMLRAVAPGGHEVSWESFAECHYIGQLVGVIVTPQDEPGGPP